MTFNYTDPDATDGIPLGQPWERVALRECIDVLNYLSQGLFINPTDFADRLRTAAETVQEMDYRPDETTPPDEPA